MSDEENYNDSEEDIDYAYSDDGNNDSAKMEEEYSQSKFHIPDSSYKIVHSQEILPMLHHMKEEISGLLGLSEDMSLILLHQLRWNKERLVEQYFSNSEMLIEKAGLSPKISPNATKEKYRENFCRICLDECQPSMLYSLPCKHQFCSTCYGGYLNSVVADGPICITVTCPEHKCTQRVFASTVETLCGTETYDKFLKYMTRNFIETSHTMRWCPSAGCEQVAVGSGITTVRCSCSYSFCFRCGSEAHDPASCHHVELWQEKCQSESETANWILANTKKCPKCSARIEKNQGCNHMSCKVCRFDFCWICLGDWKEHGQNTGGYYKCNKFESSKSSDADSNSAVARAKAELDRYLHYYQRYHAHDLSLKFASKQRENAEKRMVEMQQSEKSAWIDVQFLKQAVDQVIECRRILKYTYVLGHYMRDNSSEKELYEHHQEMLEKHTERLSELTEKEGLHESSDRTNVVNLTRITERFVNSMLSVMMEGQGSLCNAPHSRRDSK